MTALLGAGYAASSASGSGSGTDDDRAFAYSGPGLIGACVLIAAVALLFTARYPAGLYDLAVGINRWAYRLVVYLALMSDRYPPLRLDQGGDDPEGPRPPEPSTTHDPGP